MKTQISNLVRTTRFWNNIHQVRRSKLKDCKSKWLWYLYYIFMKELLFMRIKYRPSSFIEILILHIFMFSTVCHFCKFLDSPIIFGSTSFTIFTCAILKIMVDNIDVCTTTFCASMSKVCLIIQEHFQRFKIAVRTVQRVIV